MSNRGAVLVEAMVLVMVLILLDICLVYMRGTYDTKMKTMRTARTDVWERSLKACQGSSSGKATGGSGDGSLGSVSGQMQAAKSIAQGQSLTKPLDTSLSTSTATASDNAEGHATDFGALPSLSLSTRASVICNEKQGEVSQGDIRQTINSLYGSFL